MFKLLHRIKLLSCDYHHGSMSLHCSIKTVLRVHSNNGTFLQVPVHIKYASSSSQSSPSPLKIKSKNDSSSPGLPTIKNEAAILVEVNPNYIDRISQEFRELLNKKESARARKSNIVADPVVSKELTVWKDVPELTPSIALESYTKLSKLRLTSKF